MFTYVKEWQSGNISMKAFAEGIGMTRSKFEYWVRKFRSLNKSKTDNPGFIDISSAPFGNIKKQLKEEKPLKESKLEIELTFASGLNIKIYN